MALSRTLAIPPLTLALGLSLALAYLLVGGTLAWISPGIVARSWPVIYPLLAVLAALVGYLTARAMPRWSLAVTAGLLLGAWIGELGVLLVYGAMDSDLGRVGPFAIWVIATCGPLQPAAAIVGAWLSRRAMPRSAAPRS